MFRQEITVHYVDGGSENVVLTQWSIGQFGQWAARQKLPYDAQNPGAMAVVMLRFQAYAEIHRDPAKTRPAFDKWDATVLEVSAEGDIEEVDPTPGVTSAEQLAS